MLSSPSPARAIVTGHRFSAVLPLAHLIYAVNDRHTIHKETRPQPGTALLLPSSGTVRTPLCRACDSDFLVLNAMRLFFS